MNLIKLFHQRKVAKQLIKTYELGGFSAIEDSLAKLVKENEDAAIYFFRRCNSSFASYDFFKSVMGSKKIVLSNKILRSAIYNEYFYMYLETHKDELPKEQIISILQENFDSYYSNYSNDLYHIKEIALNNSEYYDIICSLIIKFPTYKSAQDIRLVMSWANNYSEKMIDAMIATNNLEELMLLKQTMEIKKLSVPEKLKNKINELIRERSIESDPKKEEKRLTKLEKSQAKLDESIKKL